MKRSYLSLLAPAALLILLFSCKKDSQELSDEEERMMASTSISTDNESEMVSDDVFNNVMGVNNEVAIGGTGIFGRSADGGREMNPDSVTCFTVIKTQLNAPAPFPVKFEINFGPNGCTGNDGRTRYGRITIVYTGRLTFPGSKATTTFENFAIDSLQVQGIHTLENTTQPGSNQRQFTRRVVDGKITKPSGAYIQWKSEKTITQVEGNATNLPIDDVFRMEGGAEGRVLRNNLLFEWTSRITEPLVKRFSCRWISRGEIRAKRRTLADSSPWVAVLNFGNGLCDSLATLTINGQTQTIQLPH